MSGKPPTITSRRERRAQARRDNPVDRPRSSRRPSQDPLWRSPIVLVSAAAVIVAIVVVLFVRPATTQTTTELTIPPTSYSADLVNGEAVGSATAPVAMEVFSDFQCPACKVLITTELPRLLTDFVAPGILRIESKDIDVLGKGDPDESLELAAGARCAAEQGRYWPFHDLVFWNQGRENRGDHDAAFIARVADQAGLDPTALSACLARPDVRQAIRDQTASALAAGINSTPTLRINGQVSVGAPGYDQLAALIRQLAAASSPSASGAASPPASTSTAPSLAP